MHSILCILYAFYIFINCFSLVFYRMSSIRQLSWPAEASQPHASRAPWVSKAF